jgi:cyclopropane-fatty-acyl-phospholipid synthase
LRVSALAPAKQSGSIRFLAGLARQTVHASLKNIKHGSLIIEENGHEIIFGDTRENSGIARVIVRDARAYSLIFKNGDIGAGEAYMLGYWYSPQLLNVIQIFVRNMQELDNINGMQSWWRSAIGFFFHWWRNNTLKQARKNISAHYDLSNDFFKLFLDETMAYSSAIFQDESQSLAQASLQKFEHICERLQLNKDDHLLEIGTGWGGLAIYAAKNHGCRVTTTTLSKEQYGYAREWVEREGLSDRITLLLKDYREIEGQFDKLVSVEMIEAVGSRYYQQYFSKCNALLKKDGLMLIQAITISDQRYQSSVNSIDFIKRYIFPGGQLPSNAIIAQHLAEDTDMQLIGLEDITRDYATTLLNWRQRFMAKLEKVRQLGADDSFIRMWEYYLCFCEGGFRERVIHTGQFLMAKPGFRETPRIKMGSN